MDSDDATFWRSATTGGWPRSAYDAALPHVAVGGGHLRAAKNVSVDAELAQIQKDLRKVRQLFFKLTKSFERAVGQMDPTLADVDSALDTARHDVTDVRRDVVGTMLQFPAQGVYVAGALIACVALWICVAVLLYQIRATLSNQFGAAPPSRSLDGYTPADRAGYWTSDPYGGTVEGPDEDGPGPRPQNGPVGVRWKENYVNFSGENLI